MKKETNRQKLARIKKTLLSCSKEIKQIADEIEDEAERQPDTNRGGIRRSKLDTKAFYLHGASDEIGYATVHVHL